MTAIGSGRYELVIPTGLLGLRGELEERGGALHFAGRLTEEHPYICDGNPGVADFNEVFERCRNQPVRFVLRRVRNGWTADIDGLLEMQTQYVGAQPPERHAVSHELVPYQSLPLTILD